MNIIKNLQEFFFTSNNWLKKSICAIGLTGISTLICRPILSLECDLPYLFSSEIHPTIASRNTDNDYRNTEGNLYDTLQKDSDFKNLVDEIEKDEKLVRELKNSNYTLLAPDNDAFNDLESDIYDKFQDEKLRNLILRYHMIRGRATPENLENRIITTMNKSKITLSFDNGDVILNNIAKAKCRPIPANEGLIIKINRVLIPPNLPQE